MPEPEVEKEPLQELHGLLIRELLNRFKVGTCPHCGCTGVSPQLMTVARQLLSDNEMKSIGGARPEPGKVIPMHLPFGSEDGELPVQRKA